MICKLRNCVHGKLCTILEASPSVGVVFVVFMVERGKNMRKISTHHRTLPQEYTSRFNLDASEVRNEKASLGKRKHEREEKKRKEK